MDPDALSPEQFAEWQGSQPGPDDEAAMNAAYPPAPTEAELDDMGRRLGPDQPPF